MRKIMHKWFWAWDFDKEERWLNKMAADGFALIAVSFCKYTFEPCAPNEYRICLELLNDLPSYSKSHEYISFVEETGAEYLGSITRWVYFRKKVDGGEFVLYSDNDSRIRHLNRLLFLIGVLCGVNLFIGSFNLFLHRSIGLDSFQFLYPFINLLIGLFMGGGFLQIFRKRQLLKKEQTLFE